MDTQNRPTNQAKRTRSRKKQARSIRSNGTLKRRDYEYIHKI